MIFLYFSFLIPLFLAIFAVRTDFYPLKAMVTLSCMGIILYAGTVLNGSIKYAQFILAAFALSIGGDYFLSMRGDEKGKKAHYFLYGIFFFFLAHGGYLLFSANEGSLKLSALFILITLFTLYYFLRIYPRIEQLSLKIAVYLYLLISCFSLALVLGFNGSLFTKFCLVTGIGLILFSDAAIGETVFCKNESWSKWILPTYYAAHMVLTLGLVV
jgi:uncharacterized membrane protein YhhN